MPRRAPGVFPPAGISVEDERSLFASSRPDEPPIPVHLPLPASTSRERRSVVSGKCRLSSLSVEPRAHGSGGRMQGPRGSHRRDSASREASRRLPFPFAAAMNSSKQALIYSFVAKGSVVLAGRTAFSGNFSTVAVQCLQKLPPNSSRAAHQLFR